MKIYLILLCFLTSCYATPTPSPKEGLIKIIAVYTKPDGSKALDIMVRQISKTIKTDSETGTDKIVIDTIYGYPVEVPLRDSIGNPVLDSLKNVKKILGYAVISKDSVNWKVQNTSIDSLLKK